jgi:hypothetical protein
MKVAIVTGDDWQGIYVDGILRDESRGLRPIDVLDALGIGYQEVDADLDWLADEGGLPKQLADVKRAR